MESAWSIVSLNFFINSFFGSSFDLIILIIFSKFLNTIWYPFNISSLFLILFILNSDFLLIDIFRCSKKFNKISVNPICLGSIPFTSTLKLHEYFIDRSVNLKHNSISFWESIFLFLGFRTILIFSSDSSTTSSRGIFFVLIKFANCSIILILFTC